MECNKHDRKTTLYEYPITYIGYKDIYIYIYIYIYMFICKYEHIYMYISICI